MRWFAPFIASVALPAAAALSLAVPGTARADGGLAVPPVLGPTDATTTAPSPGSDAFDTTSPIEEALPADGLQAAPAGPASGPLSLVDEAFAAVAQPVLEPSTGVPLTAAEPLLDAVAILAPPLAPVVHEVGSLLAATENAVDEGEGLLGDVEQIVGPLAESGLPGSSPAVNPDTSVDAPPGTIDAILGQTVTPERGLPVPPGLLISTTSASETPVDVLAPSLAGSSPSEIPTLGPQSRPASTETRGAVTSGLTAGPVIAPVSPGPDAATPPAAAGGARIPLPEFPGASACVAALALLAAFGLIRGARLCELGPPLSAICLPAVPPG